MNNVFPARDQRGFQHPPSAGGFGGVERAGPATPGLPPSIPLLGAFGTAFRAHASAITMMLKVRQEKTNYQRGLRNPHTTKFPTRKRNNYNIPSHFEARHLRTARPVTPDFEPRMRVLH